MKAIAKLKDDARRYELQEEWEKAIDAYLQVLRLFEQGDGSDLDLPLYNRVGDLYVRLGRPMDAVTYYEQAADRYAEAGLYNNAIALCNKALRYDSGRLPLLKKLGAFSASQGFFTDARRWYLEFAEKSIKRGVVDEAFSALSDLANISDDPEIRELLAHQLREHGRKADAVEELKRAHALRIAAGQRAEAAAIAAELSLLDPSVDLSIYQAPQPSQHTHDWQHAEQLPGFADLEQPVAATELEAIEEPQPETVDVEHERVDGEHERVDVEHEMLDIQHEMVEIEHETDDVEHEMLDIQHEMLDLEHEMLDLDTVAFDKFTDVEATAAAGEEDVVLDSPLDVGPLEVEVEEKHALFNLPDFHIEPRVREEAVEPPEPFPEFEDFGIELEERDLALPLFEPGDAIEDIGALEEEIEAELEEEAGDYKAGEYDNEPEPLPTVDAPQFGSIASFDEAEFGDYSEPPRRVFDFDEEQDEGVEEERTAPEETLVDEIEAAHDETFFDAGEVPNEASVDAEIESSVEAYTEPSLEEYPELSVEDYAEESVADHTGASLDEFSGRSVEADAEPPLDEYTEAVAEPEAESPPDFAMRAETEFEAEVPIAPEPEPEPAAETWSEPEPQAQSEQAGGENELQMEPTAPTPAPASTSVRRTAGNYVDLAALLGEEDEDETEESTRFVVAEMPPTGDEEKDFADMLLQFKQKVAQSIPKEDAGSHYDLGIAFKEMGLIDEAIGEFQTALRSGQEKLKVYEELGSCFMLKQDYSIAVSVLNRAQQMPYTDETELLGVYYNLGRAHEELGQRAEARAAFEKIVAVDISFQDTTQRLARL